MDARARRVTRPPIRAAPTIAALLAAGAILAGAAIEILRDRRAPAPVPGARRTVRTVRVAFVADGDTVRTADGEWVRYLGIDAPERDAPWGPEATRRNAELVLGRLVRLRIGPDPRDRYGRTLARVSLPEGAGGRGMVDEILLREGLAWMSLRPEIAPGNGDLLRAQREALAARRGLWSEPPEPAPSYVAGRFRFHRPSCPSARDIPRPARHANRWEPLWEGKAPCRRCRP